MFPLKPPVEPAQSNPVDENRQDSAGMEALPNSREDGYYFISNKGVFKWQASTKKMETQIVINQIHLLQMPLDRFCIA
jgi:hypothetical protein